MMPTTDHIKVPIANPPNGMGAAVSAPSEPASIGTPITLAPSANSSVTMAPATAASTPTSHTGLVARIDRVERAVGVPGVGLMAVPPVK